MHSAVLPINAYTTNVSNLLGMQFDICHLAIGDRTFELPSLLPSLPFLNQPSTAATNSAFRWYIHPARQFTPIYILKATLHRLRVSLIPDFLPHTFGCPVLLKPRPIPYNHPTLQDGHGQRGEVHFLFMERAIACVAAFVSTASSASIFDSVLETWSRGAA